MVDVSDEWAEAALRAHSCDDENTREFTSHEWSAIRAVLSAILPLAYERAAGVAQSAWLTCPYGEIADADTMAQLSEHTAAAIRKLGERP